MLLFNPKIFCKYRPNPEYNLTKMVLEPNYPIKYKNGWRIVKGKKAVHVFKPEWITNNSFLTPYGSFEFCDNFGPFKTPEFNPRDFFKDKNMYIVWTAYEREDKSATATLYSPKITWNNRKGFIHSPKLLEV